MRILVATDHFPPFIGGAQIQSRTLSQELRRRGHDVAVATVWQNDLPAVEEDEGVAVHRLRQLRTLPGLARLRAQHHQPPFPDPVTTFQLRRLIGRLRPDIVHSYGWISYSCSAALLGSDIPLIITSRDYAYGCAKRTLMYNGSECSGPALVKCLGCAGRHYGRAKGWTAAAGVLGSRPLLRRKTSAIHSISTYVQEMVRRDFLDDRLHGGDGDRNSVIHDVVGNAPTTLGANGAEPARLRELPDEPFMLFVGALRRVKGIEQLLAAYETLVSPPPLVLIGTIEPDTPSSFPAGVHVLTDFPHAEVMAAWERCLFGVLPSLWAEPFGTVVCEAMSRGKPVIATRPGGHTDMVIDGETGLLIERGDVAALAEAMRFLLENADERERLGEAARVRAEAFTVDVSMPRIEHLYEETLRRHAAAVVGGGSVPRGK
jgi:glycosyltransferase involved in cell wall biosynthesis